MSMPATKVWTLEDLDRLPDDGNRYELIDGELFVTPAPAPRHEFVAARLTHILVPYVTEQRLGLVYLPHGIVERTGSRTEPDLSVRQELNPDAPWDQAPVPILVVEILSPSSRRAERARKREYYARVGVAEYWIVDSKRRTVMSIQRGRGEAEHADTITWHPSGATRPLVINIPELFAAGRMT